ncbi:speckle-type poz protein [Anaeramoeba ignava]|uniref:Speckle-type poz protein n=1 Tax=Anaeramoeba ignava TaxID=1746090 RepID=A0A9Q0L715_ANAIG|nr:speckle-type poz protein [Anaeramoeba ignava]
MKKNKKKIFSKKLDLIQIGLNLKKEEKEYWKIYQNYINKMKQKIFTIIKEEKEKEIKVHKLILIIRSELYKGMFQLNVQDSSNQVHDYSKKSFKTIQELIYFLYHDKFENEIPKETQEEFSDLKDYYQLNQNSIIDLIYF